MVFEKLNSLVYRLNGKWTIGKGYTPYEDENDLWCIRNPKVGCINFRMTATPTIVRNMMQLKVKVSNIKVAEVFSDTAVKYLEHEAFLKDIVTVMKRELKSEVK